MLLIRLSSFFILILSIGFLLMSCKNVTKSTDKGNPSFDVVIHLTQTSSYCGGAAPPQEMLDALATPQALSGKEVFLRKGMINNPEDTAFLLQKISDEKGDVHFQIQEGNYYLVFANKKDHTHTDELLEKYKSPIGDYSSIDKACLKKWLENPELIIPVGIDLSREYTLNVHTPCFWNEIPCIDYTGPMPP